MNLNPGSFARFALILSFLLAFTSTAWSTHNRAGEITYRHVSGNIYEITVRTYTKSDAPADRPFLPIDWGDGSPIDSLQRSQEINIPGRNSQENVYIKQHAFPGPGEYHICVTDPNRNAGILNIDGGNSVLVVFAIRTTLRISAAFAHNNSVRFTNMPLQDACKFQPWVYTPGAVDVDGDSLSFELVPSYGNGCEPFEIGFYEFPDAIGPLGPSPNPENHIGIDPSTGVITWENPQRNGEYNIAFTVTEWRDGVQVGKVLRDMQIIVDDCNNTPPEIDPLPDTCVVAGSELNIEVTANDDDSDNVVISGFGDPFEVDESPAVMIPFEQMPPASATFNWSTVCGHVRLQPYKVSFEAKDNGPGTELVDVTTMEITVISPAPENLVAEAVGSMISLTWEESICDQAVGYDVYRRIGESGFVPDYCETGVPAYTGYTKIAHVEGVETTDYLDMDEMIFGRKTCYMVVAVFPDGAESYASNEACAEIKFEIPIIKKNSVGSTSTDAGRDTLQWRGPIELDTDVFPGPYRYRVMRGGGYGEPDELVYESEESADLESMNTSLISENLNTEDTAHTYRVVLLSDGEFAAQSNAASSLYIESEPGDAKVEITWREEVPWINFSYDVYRQTDGVGEFVLVGQIDTLGFVDSGLENNREYCHYIVASGSYFAIGESDTLINYSQISCTVPYDHEPPCAPELTAQGDCRDLVVEMSWTNPNESCADTEDVLTYHVYYSPTQGGEFTLLEVIEGAENISVVYDLFEVGSISGCYAVTALDSLSLWPDGEWHRNESDFSNVICFDDCPEYELPNVFTPNGDGRNDVFAPFPYRAVESVEMTIFNRWGGIVFQTTDPDILWDGTNPETGERVSDGTYYYVCRVFTRRLEGLVPIDLAGYVSVFGDPEKISH